MIKLKEDAIATLENCANYICQWPMYKYDYFGLCNLIHKFKKDYELDRNSTMYHVHSHYNDESDNIIVIHRTDVVETMLLMHGVLVSYDEKFHVFHLTLFADPVGTESISHSIGVIYDNNIGLADAFFIAYSALITGLVNGGVVIQRNYHNSIALFVLLLILQIEKNIWVNEGE
jgi:Tfp pilus assembly protein PilZ